MQKRKFTVVTQLHEKNNCDIIEYIESSRSDYARARRETFYAIKHGGFNKSQYNTYLQQKYGIVKRTANSIIFDAQGRFNIVKGLKEYERKQLERKISYLEGTVIPKLVEQRNHNSTVLRNGGFISLVKQRNLRLKIVAKKARLKIQVDNSAVITRSNGGTIGLDFNKGFVTLSETNKYGHLIQTQILTYRFKSGDKTKTDLQHIANHVTKVACRTSKDVCIEDLDFKTKKSETETKQDKKYNEMIHSLTYRQFSDVIESATYQNKVNLIKVNPAWTSWLAERIYCPTMKLNTHVGASYVIARRGQGYKDTVR